MTSPPPMPEPKNHWLVMILLGSFNALLGFIVVIVLTPLAAWCLYNTAEIGKKVEKHEERLTATEMRTAEIITSVREIREKVNTINETRFTSEDGKAIESKVAATEARLLREIDQLRSDIRAISVYYQRGQPGPAPGAGG